MRIAWPKIAPRKSLACIHEKSKISVSQCLGWRLAVIGVTLRLLHGQVSNLANQYDK